MIWGSFRGKLETRWFGTVLLLMLREFSPGASVGDVASFLVLMYYGTTCGFFQGRSRHSAEGVDLGALLQRSCGCLLPLLVHSQFPVPLHSSLL